MSRIFRLAAICIMLSGCAQETGKDSKNAQKRKGVQEVIADAAPFLILVPVALGFLVFSVANAQAVNNDEEI